MAEVQRLENALRKADAAGNVEDARRLAAEIRRQRAVAETMESRLGAEPFPPGPRGESVSPSPPPATIPEEVGAGLALGFGLPADLINAGAGLAGFGSERPPFGSARIADTMRNAAPVAPLGTDPETFSGQLARGGGAAVGCGCIA